MNFRIRSSDTHVRHIQTHTHIFIMILDLHSDLQFLEYLIVLGSNFRERDTCLWIYCTLDMLF